MGSPTDPPTSVLSPASTVNSSLSCSRAAVTPPLAGGGSVVGISPHSPSLHQRHPASGDLYAVVSRPGSTSRPPPSSLTFRNTLTSSLALPTNGQAPLNGLGLNNGVGTSLPRSLPPPLDQEADQVLFQSTRGDHAVQQGLQQQGVQQQGVQQGLQQGVHYI